VQPHFALGETELVIAVLADDGAGPEPQQPHRIERALELRQHRLGVYFLLEWRSAAMPASPATPEETTAAE
jgi:hypothetical protein